MTAIRWHTGLLTGVVSLTLLAPPSAGAAATGAVTGEADTGARCRAYSHAVRKATPDGATLYRYHHTARVCRNHAGDVVRIDRRRGYFTDVGPGVLTGPAWTNQSVAVGKKARSRMGHIVLACTTRPIPMCAIRRPFVQITVRADGTAIRSGNPG